MEREKMGDIHRIRVNRNSMSGFRGHKAPPRGRGGELEHAVAER